MNCAVCKRDTSPVIVTGRDYCSVCGTPYQDNAIDTTPAKPAHPDPPARHHTLDLSVKTAPTAPAAAAVHSRVHSKHVVDLRGAAPKPETPKSANVILKPHHPAGRSSEATEKRHNTEFSGRLNQARQVDRSQSISRFAGERTSHKAMPAIAASHKSATLPATKTPAGELPSHTTTQHQAMAELAKTAPPPPETPLKSVSFKPKYRPNLKLSPVAGRIATTAAAIALMASYIWLHNYPKLALQNADNQAGIAATMPSYVPSSYNLAHTSTQPGLITLSFHSPSDTQALTIAQQRTSWDSSSLIDDYLGQTTDDYAAVQGQGLTIYLYGNNDATWVNHGIWYSIEGAGQLSRAEILKIAYSM